VVPITTALHRLAPTKFLLGSSLVLDVGQKLDVEQMRSRLEASGYRYVDTVYEHGEFTVRGALIDLFPMGSKLPYRIDLFDDEIETLRTFDPENQRSIDKVDSVKLLPAREFPLQKDAVTRFKARFPRAFRCRLPSLPDLPGSEQRHYAGRYRVLPAAIFRRDLDAVRLSAPGHASVLAAGHRTSGGKLLERRA
jgi:transcription-repair coupling factor (superfamily II helicase)